MHLDGVDIMLTADELTTLTATAGPRPGRLCLLPGTSGPTGTSGPMGAGAPTVASLQGLPAADKAALHQAIASLAAPAKVLELHASLADETFTRQTFAWPSASTKDLTLLNPGNAACRIGTRSLSAVQTLIRDTLAADGNLPVEALNVPLPTQAVVTLLAIIDHLRYARRYAELVYEPPVVSFTPVEVLARFEDAEIDDFRWPLLFFEKLTPPGALASYTAETIAVGLQALQNADLIEPLTDDQITRPEPDQLYRLRPAGDAIADTLLHEVSKVGISVSECLPGVAAPDGGVGIGQDVGLLVRGATRLVLFLVSGTNGAVALMDGEALTTLLNGWFEPPTDEAATAARMPGPGLIETRQSDTPPLTKPLFCSQCGAQLKPGNQFCVQCGAPIRS